MQLPSFREIREVQCTSDVNAYLEARWLFIGWQSRQATDAQGVNGYFVYVVGSTDHSWDPFSEETSEERYKRALLVVSHYEAKHGKPQVNVHTRKPKSARKRISLRERLANTPEFPRMPGWDDVSQEKH